MSRARSALLALLLALLFAGGVRVLAGEKQAFTSSWRDREVRVDGVEDEWRPLLQAVKGEHFSVAFMNDDDALYFCLVTTNKNAVKQISRMGLTLWVDPAGGKQKTFGVRFPSRYAVRPKAGEGEQPPPGGGPMEAIEVLGPGGAKDVTPVANGTAGMQAQMRAQPDLLVYELKVPLRKTEELARAPEVDPGAALQIRLETPDWRGPLPAGGSGWPPVSVGVAGPHGGVFYPGPDTSLLKPIEVSATLRLAAGPGK